MNYANQNKIIIKNFDNIIHKKGSTDSFLQPIDWIYYDKALDTLSSNAFKLWFYLLRWNGKGAYEFSPTNLMTALNIKAKNTIYNARNELIDKNYLKEEKENIYYFYPCGTIMPKNDTMVNTAKIDTG